MEKTETSQVESFDAGHVSEDKVSPLPGDSQTNVTGTVRLLLDNETVLLPTPSPDPKG